MRSGSGSSMRQYRPPHPAVRGGCIRMKNRATGSARLRWPAPDLRSTPAHRRRSRYPRSGFRRWPCRCPVFQERPVHRCAHAGCRRHGAECANARPQSWRPRFSGPFRQRQRRARRRPYRHAGSAPALRRSPGLWRRRFQGCWHRHNRHRCKVSAVQNGP